MNIPYFGTHQNLVFVPALLTALIPTVLVVLPVVFAPALARTRAGRALRVAAFLVAAAVLVLVAVQAGAGLRTLTDQQQRVGQEIATTYDLRLDPADVHELIDGGKPEKVLPEVAQKAGLESPQKPHTLKLVPTSTDANVYELEIGDRPWPKS